MLAQGKVWWKRLFQILAVAAFALWPIIPIFFIQVHKKPERWRKLGVITYLVVLMEWSVLAGLVIVFQDFLVGQELELGVLSWLGLVLMILGVTLHIWTGKLLGLKGIIGYSELVPQSGSQKLITAGPFSVVRHPTYLAHTLMFVGVFLMTGYVGTGILAGIDFLSSYFVITPPEEKELLGRFGNDYQRYKEDVPKFFPRSWK